MTGAVSGQLSVAMVHVAASGARKHTGITADALNNAASNLELAIEGVPSGSCPMGSTPNSWTAWTSSVTPAAPRSPFQGRQRQHGRRRRSSRAPGYGHPGTVRTPPGRPREPRSGVVLPQQHLRPGPGLLPPDETAPALINVAPLSVAGRLREGLFVDHTVILTSATLAIGSAFEPAAGGLGLVGPGAPGWTGVDVGSPFEDPEAGHPLCRQAPAQARPGHIPGSTGRTGKSPSGPPAAGPCASFPPGAPRGTAEAMRPRLDMDILCQGDLSMTALVRQFADEPDTCLFGTMSLWQGVDHRGVVPARRDRQDPVPAAGRSSDDRPVPGRGTGRRERLHERLGNPRRDPPRPGSRPADPFDIGQGVVAVLDSRLSTERYGAFLRAALPPFWPTTDPAVALAALERLSKESGQPAS